MLKVKLIVLSMTENFCSTLNPEEPVSINQVTGSQMIYYQTIGLNCLYSTHTILKSRGRLDTSSQETWMPRSWPTLSLQVKRCIWYQMIHWYTKLKALIVRISHSTAIVPKGMFTVTEGEEREVQPADEGYKLPKFDQIR